MTPDTTEEPCAACTKEVMDQLVDQLHGMVKDIQSAAVKAHLLSMCAGHDAPDRQTLVMAADEFCVLARQVAADAGDLSRVLKVLRKLREQTA